MENILPEVGELWVWNAGGLDKESDRFLILGEPEKNSRTAIEEYLDPYTIKVMWLSDGEIGSILIDRADMNLHIYKVA